MEDGKKGGEEEGTNEGGWEEGRREGWMDGGKGARKGGMEERLEKEGGKGRIYGRIMEGMKVVPSKRQLPNLKTILTKSNFSKQDKICGSSR